MINPLHVVEGHINLLLKKKNLLPEDTKALGDLRMQICKVCHTLPNGIGLVNGKYCDKSKGGCGCDMEAKTLTLGAACPIGRW